MNAARRARNELRVYGPCAVCCLAAMLPLCLSGCVTHYSRITYARDAIPARFLPAELAADPRNADIPIDFHLLEQRPRATHIIDAGDLLGIIVQGVVPAVEEGLPSVATNSVSGRLVYPATGLPHGPVVGVPMYVSAEGTLPLPLVGSISVRGLTLRDAAEAIRKAYVVDHKILRPGRDTVLVTFIKPRVHRVLVVREDIATGQYPSYMGHSAIPYTRRPPSAIFDLPTGQNDVLHALLTSGGLPGIDAQSELWVLRGRADAIHPLPAVEGEISAASPLNMTGMRTLRIPLRMRAGETLSFQEQDIILADGDIVYVPGRIDEMFYTGGLLVGGRFPLPRDRSIGVAEAMTIANGGPVGGPAGVDGISRNFVVPGLGIIYPTQVIVVRKLPDGEQLKIGVRVGRAAADPSERLVIQPDDFIMLQFTPSEYIANFLLNLFRPDILIAPIKVNSGTNAASANVGVTPPPNPEPPPETTTTDAGATGP